MHEVFPIHTARTRKNRVHLSIVWRERTDWLQWILPRVS